METCCENTAAARPGTRYLVCGEACYLTREHPPPTPPTPDHHARARLCADENRELKGSWDDCEAKQQSDATEERPAALSSLNERCCDFLPQE